jgi:hypothetical protein
MQFTNLHWFRSNPEIPVDPAAQIKAYIDNLNVETKNWQILSPAAGIREIWFETVEAVAKPELLKGYQKAMRDMALEKKGPGRPKKEN